MPFSFHHGIGLGHYKGFPYRFIILTDFRNAANIDAHKDKYNQLTLYGYNSHVDFVEFPCSMEKQEFNNMFGRFVKSKRAEKGWSQSELASRIGHNSQNVSRMERGKISPTLYWCSETLAPAFEMGRTEFLVEFEAFRKTVRPEGK